MKIEQPGPTTFIELADTPNTYLGAASDVVKVNVGETGLEFGTGGGGAGAPSMGGTSNTGLTTALPATANAPGTVTTSFWGCIN